MTDRDAPDRPRDEPPSEPSLAEEVAYLRSLGVPARLYSPAELDAMSQTWTVAFPLARPATPEDDRAPEGERGDDDPAR